MSEQKLWGARLKEGVSRGNLLVYYIVTLITMMVVVSTNVLQPYLLSTFMKIPLLEIGSATANIALVNEFVLLVFVGLWGVISDKSGRRFVWGIGLIVMGIGYGVMPIAEQVIALIGFRAIYTVGVAATTGMMATVIADYVVNEDRGKASAIMGIMNGVGAATGALLLGKMPQMYSKMDGVDGIQAGWYAYTTDIAICVVLAVVVVVGLSKKTPAGATRATFAEKIKIGLQAAKDDAGVALSYAAAFVSRADLVIAGLYFPLWFSKHFQDKVAVTKTIVGGSAEHNALLERISDLGLDVGTLGHIIAPNSVEHLGLLEAACAKGIATGGMIIGMAGVAGLFFAPVIGIMCDKINRTTALAITLMLNF
ncbi:MAG: MFS transporter, partial [Proteobacteria bacterium]|nr:MFS transporter [Pseudomonadota bacterium]